MEPPNKPLVSPMKYWVRIGGAPFFGSFIGYKTSFLIEILDRVILSKPGMSASSIQTENRVQDADCAFKCSEAPGHTKPYIPFIILYEP